MAKMRLKKLNSWLYNQAEVPMSELTDCRKKTEEKINKSKQGKLVKH